MNPMSRSTTKSPSFQTLHSSNFSYIPISPSISYLVLPSQWGVSDPDEQTQFSKCFPEQLRFVFQYHRPFVLPSVSLLAPVSPSLTLSGTSEHLSVCFGSVSRYRSGISKQNLFGISELRLDVYAPFNSRASSVDPGTSENYHFHTSEQVALSCRNELLHYPVPPSLLHWVPPPPPEFLRGYWTTQYLWVPGTCK